jgi:hypothetical protein
MNKANLEIISYVKRAKCPHSTACSLVAESGDGLRIRRIHASIVTTQSHAAENLGVERGADLSPIETNTYIMKCYKGPRIWTT